MKLLHFALILATLFSSGRADGLSALLKERLGSVVAVEFVIQTETDRHPQNVLGTVIDDQGTIILPGSAIPSTVAIDQLHDFKIYRPGSGEEHGATYLGVDALTGWHFLRAAEELRPELVPITRFAAKEPFEPQLGDDVWGIGLRDKDEEYAPYLLRTQIALVTRLPAPTAITAQDVAGPGLPVFASDGRLVGLAENSFGQNYLLFVRNHDAQPVMLVNVEESSVVLLAEEVLANLNRIPTSVSGRPIPWVGINGLQPVDPEVGRLLKLEKQSGMVVSDLVDDGPAAKAGLQDGDIIVALDGKTLPRLKPDHIVPDYFGQEILRHRPGQELALSVLRGTEHKDIKIVLGDQPKMVREAAHRYFERLGLTVREFLVEDSINNHAKPSERAGVVVGFVKPNGPAATAGLRSDDWIREVDGMKVKDFATAVEKLQDADAGQTRGEFVLLVSRGGETQVIRIKLT